MEYSNAQPVSSSDQPSQLVEYVAYTLSNKSAQELFALSRKLDLLLDEYIDSFEVDDDAYLSLLKPDALHMTVMECDDAFSYKETEYAKNCECDSVSLIFHDGYIALEFDCDILESEIDRMVRDGAEPREEDPIPYVSLARAMGEGWDEEMWNDFIDWVEDEYPNDITVTAVSPYAIENKFNDWENNPKNFVDYDEYE